MKKNYLFTFAIFLLFFSCTEKSPIIGSWIEKDNYINPEIWEISQDDFTIQDGSAINLPYLIKKDTFIFNNTREFVKTRFEVINSKLNFYSLDGDSLIISLEKNTYNNFIDYFNRNKNTLINLPALKSKRNKFQPRFPSTFAFDKNDVSKIFINGEKVVLDSSTYIKIFEIKSRHGYSTFSRYAELFCDKELKLKDVNRLKTELQKAGMQQITYVTKDGFDTLYGSSFRLPYLGSYLPDSIKKKFPILPPTINFAAETFNSNDILCKISMTYKEINGKTISEEMYKAFLSDKIKSESGFILHLNFDDQMNYERYLLELMRTMDIYENIKNEYSNEMFNEPDHENLDSEIRMEIRKIFPIKIREVYDEEYEKLKKNAL